ncbi:MAG: tetratricopeptide repeat protein [Deltaproteobacteria bacterium]|nr:tetratricopeptide repeat protein [Deltaproteobacteria bacterium]
MEGLMNGRSEIAQVVETLKKAFDRVRRNQGRRPAQGKHGSEARWRTILLRCLIGVNVLLLASVITFTIKPAWLAQLKGRFSPRPMATVEKKKASAKPLPRPAAKTVKAPKAKTVTQATPAPQEPKTIAKRIERPQVVVPKKVARPHVTTPPSLPPKVEDKELDDYMEIGALYAQKGRYQKAEGLFQKVLKEDPSSAKAHNNLGFIYLKQGKYELAEKEFKEALKIDPASVLPYYNLACLYSRKGMEVEALIYLKRALNRDERVKLWAMSDEDFEGLRSDVVFQELVGISSPEEEGIKEGSR